MSDETITFRIDMVDSDFKKLEKYTPLVIAHGNIGGSPIEIILQREHKRGGKPPYKTGDKVIIDDSKLPEATDASKILSLIPAVDMRHTDEIYTEAHKRWHIERPKAFEEVRKMLREGTIYEPREGFLRKT